VGFPVPGVEAKLDGAEDRLEEFKKVRDKAAVTDLLTLRTDRDRQGRVRVRVKELAEIPKEWHVWIGECVHDMRSALDHIAYALNVAGSGADPPPNEAKSQFPLYTVGKDFRAMRKGGRRRPDKCMIGYFPRGTRTFIEAIQPYHSRKHQLVPLWLRVLVELSNIDKHRKFPVAAVTPMFYAFPKAVEGHAVPNAKGARTDL
jgi:hypothetical protein